MTVPLENAPSSCEWLAGGRKRHRECVRAWHSAGKNLTTALLGGSGLVNQALLMSCIQQLHTSTGDLALGVRVSAIRPAWACEPGGSAQFRPSKSFLMSFSNQVQRWVWGLFFFLPEFEDVCPPKNPSHSFAFGTSQPKKKEKLIKNEWVLNESFPDPLDSCSFGGAEIINNEGK